MKSKKTDSKQLSNSMDGLVDLLARLRSPGGCPWDAKQNDSSIKLYLLEEAYEVLDAVEKASPSDVCQELGDLLFQIIFLARLAEERDEFGFSDVVEKITEKMIRRHPHVFGSVQVNGAEEVADNWARIKEAEKKNSGEQPSTLSSIPRNLPALLRAHRLSERSAKISENSPSEEDSWENVIGSFEALREALRHKDKAALGCEIGRHLLGLANLARVWGLNSEHLLRTANNEFIASFEKATQVV
jgi:MazG family protein